MSRRGRRRGAVPPPTGPLDPWTGLPGERSSGLTPRGQVEQLGLFADGVTRNAGVRRGARRTIARVALWLVVIAVAVGLVGVVSSYLAGGR